MDLLNGYYRNDWFNADALDAPVSDSEFPTIDPTSPDAINEGPVGVPVTSPTYLYGYTEPSNTPCDYAFTIQPNVLNATGKFLNVGEVAIIGAAIAGIGQAVGSIFGAKQQKLYNEGATQQAAIDLAKEADRRITTLNIILGGTVLLTLTVGAIVVLRYTKRK